MTFTILNAIRDCGAATLQGKGHKAVLYALALRGEVHTATVANLATSAGVSVRTARRALSTLEGAGYLSVESAVGKPSEVRIVAPSKWPCAAACEHHPGQCGHTTPANMARVEPNPGQYGQGTPANVARVEPNPGQCGQGTPANVTAKEYIYVNNNLPTNTKIIEGAGGSGDLSAAERLARWRPIWEAVIGRGALPTLEQLRRANPRITEGGLSHCLGEVALARAEGGVRKPYGLFWAKVKECKGDESLWTMEAVKRALTPSAFACGRDARSYDKGRAFDPGPPLDQEARALALAAARAGFAGVFGKGGAQ